MSAPAQQQRRITRYRELRSCTECRRRKMKCDRRLPSCTSCQKRGDADKAMCFYAIRKPVSQYSSQTEARLECLEQLVHELSEPQRETIVRGSPESLHHGATHWSAMLEEIDGLRTVIREYEADADSGGGDDGDEPSAGILFGGGMKVLSLHQVLAQFLPPRSRVDRLVGSYFRTKSVVAPFVHSVHFFRLYQIFWNDPHTNPPLWTAILFSILDIAARIVSADSSPTRTCDDYTPDRFDIAAAHCLAIGEYYQPQRFALEAVLLYAHSKCLAGVDLGPEMAILLGTTVRLATVMGYHRDVDSVSRPGISAFEGEMRRRTWSMCMHLDMLISFQLGLPSVTQYPTWDTKPPTNLLDSDFDEDTAELPPARPMTESTQLLFYIAKHQLLAVFEKVVRHKLSATDRPDEELEAIDREIRETFAALPEIFQDRSMMESVIDSPSIKVTRLCVYFIYQKCLCVLHRNYIIRGRQDSLRICYMSASNLARRFLDMYREFESGGQLETERWFMSSITWHDFLLACTSICLALCYTKYHAPDLASLTLLNVEESLVLLNDAAIVCGEQSAKRKDTKKVLQLLNATIKQFSNENNGNEPAASPLIYNGQHDQNEAPNASWQVVPESENDWPYLENATNLASNTEWAFLDQFLNIPNQDLMTGIQY